MPTELNKTDNTLKLLREGKTYELQPYQDYYERYYQAMGRDAKYRNTTWDMPLRRIFAYIMREYYQYSPTRLQEIFGYKPTNDVYRWQMNESISVKDYKNYFAKAREWIASNAPPPPILTKKINENNLILREYAMTLQEYHNPEGYNTPQIIARDLIEEYTGCEPNHRTQINIICKNILYHILSQEYNYSIYKLADIYGINRTTLMQSNNTMLRDHYNLHAPRIREIIELAGFEVLPPTTRPKYKLEIY